MSFRAFVVCEDHTLDQYVAVPVIKAMLSHLGKPQASVKAVTSPHLSGISQVETHFEDVAERYSQIGDLVFFVLDRDALDGLDGRGDRAAAFAGRVQRLEAAVSLKVVVILAVEETEVWAIAGSRGDISASWSEVRAERDSKERYFAPLVNKGDAQQPGAGRSRLIGASLRRGWQALSSACPELREAELLVESKIAAASGG